MTQTVCYILLVLLRFPNEQLKRARATAAAPYANKQQTPAYLWLHSEFKHYEVHVKTVWSWIKDVLEDVTVCICSYTLELPDYNYICSFFENFRSEGQPYQQSSQSLKSLRSVMIHVSTSWSSCLDLSAGFYMVNIVTCLAFFACCWSQMEWACADCTMHHCVKWIHEPFICTHTHCWKHVPAARLVDRLVKLWKWILKYSVMCIESWIMND